MINSLSIETPGIGKKGDLGDILVEKGIITPEMLSEAMKLTGEDAQKRRRNLPWVLLQHI